MRTLPLLFLILIAFATASCLVSCALCQSSVISCLLLFFSFLHEGFYDCVSFPTCCFRRRRVDGGPSVLPALRTNLDKLERRERRLGERVIPTCPGLSSPQGHKMTSSSAICHLEVSVLFCYGIFSAFLCIKKLFFLYYLRSFLH